MTTLVRAALLLGLLLSRPLARAQQSDQWVRFDDPKTGKYGYKDARGVVRVKPRFADPGVITAPPRFAHLAAVTVDKRHAAYLLKSGRLVARDSVHIFDLHYDCESEATIRFRDRQRDRVGFLNARGQAIVPAVYNYATPFHNGLAVVQQGARRHCWGEGDTLGRNCEHLGWQGGRTLLINPRGEVLVRDIGPGVPLRTLNWYSLQTNPAPADTVHRVQLPGVDGTVYSFVDYQREFTGWFFVDFLPALRTGDARQLAARCFPDLHLSRRPFDGWHPYQREAFVAAYGPQLRQDLAPLRPGQAGVSVGEELFNWMINDNPSFRAFYTPCGAHFAERYPTFEVSVTFPAPAGSYDEHFSFIRTATGYQLYQVSW
jgi:hypothetical protein